MRRKLVVVSALVAVSVVLGGCASTGLTAAWSTEEKIVACVATAAAGGAIGMFLGKATGSDDAERDLAVGAAVGGAACGVWLAFENERDKRRMAEAQLAAVQREQTYTDSWDGDDGRKRSVTVTPSSETAYVRAKDSGATPKPQICRAVTTDATVENKTSRMEEVWCRNEVGDWAKADQEMVVA